MVRHRWITAEVFAAKLRAMIETHRRLALAEPIPLPTPQQIQHAASIVVTANEPVLGRYRYRDLAGKVSYVFYELIKQHVFFNGNKRIATYFLLYLLEAHDFMLTTPPTALADFALKVAKSDARDRQRVMAQIQRKVRRDTTTIEEWKALK